MKTISSKTLLKIKERFPSMTTEEIIEAARELREIKERFPSLSTRDLIEIARTLPEDA